MTTVRPSTIHNPLLTGRPVNYGEATVTRERNGNITLDAGRGNDNINVSKGRDGMYNVNVNGQNFKFSAEEMSRLTIKGGKGNDNINIAGNVDVKVRVDGGRGNDNIRNAANGTVINGGRGADNITNTGSGVTIHGGRGNDNINSIGVGNTITGGRGNDNINSVGFANTAVGGPGRDNVVNTGAFFNHQALLTSLLGGIRQQDFGIGSALGLGGPQMQALQMLGMLQQAQMSQFQGLVGNLGFNQLQACTTGCVPRPSVELSGPPAGQGLQKNPAGWPEGSTRTAGGYTIVPEGNTSWKIYGPDQKPGDKPVTHVHGDPHVDQKDGTRWDFTKNSDFVLPDGTRINCKTSSESGYSVSTGLEITNGADRVSVGGLDGKPTVSDVQHDGYEWRAQHMASNPNRDTFRLGGDGDDWFLERNGQDMGKITGAYMDSKTGAYQQVVDGNTKYNIDPNLRPPFGSEAWGNMLRGESLDRIARMGLDPASANAIGQLFHADHSQTQLQNALDTLGSFAGPFGALRMMFQGPGEAFRALGSMGDAMNSLMSLNRDLMLQRTAFMF